MPRWVRLLQPLLSGVFTVDNLDYVRRDAHFTGVHVGIDVERLRRYAYVGERGLTLFESGIPALEGFLGARLLLYQQVYFHRTVRAIDLDLGEVFAPSIRAIFGDRSPVEPPGRLRGPRRVRPPPPGGALVAGPGHRSRRHRCVRATAASSARSPTGGAGSSCGGRAGAWMPRSAPSSRPGPSPTPSSHRSARRSRAASRSTWPSWTPGSRTSTRNAGSSSQRRDGSTPALSRALPRIPGYALIARRYRRID